MAWLSSPFLGRQGSGDTLSLPRESPNCLISVYLSRHTSAAFERLTHLLFSKNPEVMELFNQGVGAASCWREEWITNTLFPSCAATCPHMQLWLSHQCCWGGHRGPSAQHILTNQPWRELWLLSGPPLWHWSCRCVWPSLFSLLMVTSPLWGLRPPCHFSPAHHLFLIDSQDSVGAGGVELVSIGSLCLFYHILFLCSVVGRGSGLHTKR